MTVNHLVTGSNPVSGATFYGQLAQSVEQVTENHCVLGSIPRLATTSTFTTHFLHGQLAQSVEQVTENHCVLGSIPRLATILITSFYLYFHPITIPLQIMI